jgi:hypothetical protein
MNVHASASAASASFKSASRKLAGLRNSVAQILDTVEKLFGEAKNSQSALTVFFYLFDFIEVGKTRFLKKSLWEPGQSAFSTLSTICAQWLQT